MAALRADPNNPELIERTFLALDLGRQYRRGGQARVTGNPHRPQGPAQPLGARRPCAQAAALPHRPPEFAPRHPRPDHRPRADAAARLERGRLPATAKQAIETIDKLKGPDWYNLFKDYHAGLILDLAGKHTGRRQALRGRLQARPDHAAGGRSLWQLGVALRQAARAQAVPGLRQGAAAPSADHRGDWTASSSGRTVPQIVNSPAQGGAEVLYGIGSSFGRRGGEDLGLIYLQLSLDLWPQHALALLSLADLYENLKKPDLALAVYAKAVEEVAALPQCRDPARHRPRFARSHRRGQERPAEAGRQRSDRSRRHHGARQHHACAQAIRRMRRRLFQGHRPA